MPKSDFYAWCLQLVHSGGKYINVSFIVDVVKHNDFPTLCKSQKLHKENQAWRLLLNVDLRFIFVIMGHNLIILQAV